MTTLAAVQGPFPAIIPFLTATEALLWVAPLLREWWPSGRPGPYPAGPVWSCTKGRRPDSVAEGGAPRPCDVCSPRPLLPPAAFGETTSCPMPSPLWADVILPLFLSLLRMSPWTCPGDSAVCPRPEKTKDGQRER